MWVCCICDGYITILEFCSFNGNNNNSNGNGNSKRDVLYVIRSIHVRSDYTRTLNGKGGKDEKRETESERERERENGLEMRERESEVIVRGEITTRILFTYRRSWVLRYRNACIHTAQHTHTCIYLSKIKYPIRTQYIILDAPFYYFSSFFLLFSVSAEFPLLPPVSILLFLLFARSALFQSVYLVWFTCSFRYISFQFCAAFNRIFIICWRYMSALLHTHIYILIPLARQPEHIHTYIILYRV